MVPPPPPILLYSNPFLKPPNMEFVYTHTAWNLLWSRKKFLAVKVSLAKPLMTSIVAGGVECIVAPLWPWIYFLKLVFWTAIPSPSPCPFFHPTEHNVQCTVSNDSNTKIRIETVELWWWAYTNLTGLNNIPVLNLLFLLAISDFEAHKLLGETVCKIFISH
jgi:hypothetical protein